MTGCHSMPCFLLTIFQCYLGLLEKNQTRLFVPPVRLHAQRGKKIVHCRMCHLQFPGEKCMKGYGRCMATTEEACTVGKIFKTDGSFWLTFMGCLKNCANVRNIPWSIYRVSFTCCRGYDLCNENL
ncbi:prostate and testis expressed protein 1 isoform X1 [Octodon degus]|uniref:Prostate and testis expressed protein 1 isoform X1 n=1 Tax=Octodon degus TaxID=10160 RepID=A0A6P6DBL9_OCTDE|nr:prostate and testis expressed protein 1 isoform X1 [Octodon degus]